MLNSHKVASEEVVQGHDTASFRPTAYAALECFTGDSASTWPQIFDVVFKFAALKDMARGVSRVSVQIAH